MPYTNVGNKLTMTIQQFNLLSNHEQLRNLLIRATCIADRKTDDTLILLFQIQRYYVEVIFDTSCTKVTGSRYFEDMDELQPYLEQVNLSEVL